MFKTLRSEKIIWKEPWFYVPIALWTVAAFGLLWIAESEWLCMIAGGLLGGAGHLVSLGRTHQSMNRRIYRGILLDPMYSALVAWLICSIVLYVEFGSVSVKFSENHRLPAIFVFSAFIGLGADAILDRLQAKFLDEPK